jgi:hypothetical protein
MATVLTAALAALQIAAAQQPADTADAFLDARAAALVAEARQARAVQQATLTAYRATARERATARLRTPGRDRLLYRREMVAALDWDRAGPSTVTLLGAREYVPLPGAGVRVLRDAAREALDVAFEPQDFTTYIGIGNFRFGTHPLNEGGEADYQYRSGERSTVVLQDGSSVVLDELVVLPRRAVPALVSGSVWLEEGTGRVVQEAWRKAAPIDAESVPFIGRLSVEPRAILIEHSLWELRWWLPRFIAIDGHVRAGRLALVPFRYERTYGDYELEGMPPEAVLADTLEAETAPPPPQTPQRWRVVMPEDLTTLVHSEHLPESIFDEGAAPLRADAISPLRQRLDLIEPPRVEFGGGRAFVEFAPLDQVRFNRVEGLSFTARGGLDIGGVRPFADARVATAGRVLRGAAGVEAITTIGEIRLATYDRVHPTDPASRPFNAANSLSTFLLGDDYGQYFSARGAELVRQSVPEARTPWTLRLYAEEQDSVRARDLFTLQRLLGGRTWLRAGLPTQPATQYGVALDLAVGGGLGPEQLQWRLEPRVHAAFGGFDYGQASVIASVNGPLPLPGPFGGGLTAGLEAAVGVSGGTVPGQALWFLGGAPTVRGYPPASTAGEHYWRARAELGTTAPALRAAVFGDVGRAYGVGFLFEEQPTLLALGVGASFIEGLVRVDLARALRFRRGWRVQLAFDNVL